jgi:hypothetical protein
VSSSEAKKRHIIRIPKPPYRKKRANMHTPSDLPDVMSSFEYLHQEEVGKVIRKCSVPPLCDADIDPKFASREYSEQIDGDYLRKISKSAHPSTMPPDSKLQIL